MNHGVFNNMPKVAKAHALVIKADAAKTVFIPHFHTVVAAGALGDNILPDAQFAQQLLAGGVNRRHPQRRRRIRA